jgi:hypothetical protein
MDELKNFLLSGKKLRSTEDRKRSHSSDRTLFSDFKDELADSAAKYRKRQEEYATPVKEEKVEIPLLNTGPKSPTEVDIGPDLSVPLPSLETTPLSSLNVTKAKKKRRSGVQTRSSQQTESTPAEPADIPPAAGPPLVERTSSQARSGKKRGKKRNN